MSDNVIGTNRVNIKDINPLEHLTSDLAKARFNYESILNGLVEWNASKLQNVTVRLMCDTEPGFVDYTFPTKGASEGDGVNNVDPEAGVGAYSYTTRFPISAMIADDSYYNDRLDVRTNVMDNGGSKWRTYVSVVLYDEEYTHELLAYRHDSEEGLIRHEGDGEGTLEGESGGEILTVKGVKVDAEFYKGQFVKSKWKSPGLNRVFWISDHIEKDDVLSDFNSKAVFQQWDSRNIGDYINDDAEKYLFVVYEHKVYRPTGTLTRDAPSSVSSGWEYFCDEFVESETDTFPLEHGKIYLYTPNGDYDYAELFIYTGSDTLYGYPPYTLDEEENRMSNDGWTEDSVILLPISDIYDKTNSLRWIAETDIESLVLRRMTEGYGSMTADIRLKPSVRIVGNNTEDNGGLAIFDTANYSEWPGTTPMWHEGFNYSTDPNIGADGRQTYSAQMVFDHANPHSRQCNIINYDGPDLDQGLCIYLPVESLRDGKIVYPNDGRTFEFLFRIWPNPAYNGKETADLIINKAQIYVYSVPDRSHLQCHGMPIAKFSMARLTNFYVFSENIAVPNRPVLYKAKFVYSGEDKTWKTYDYYQIPDCVFLSPSGFVNPDNRSENTYGVETAGFPLMQDPFSNYDLSPVLVDDSFRNRIDG